MIPINYHHLYYFWMTAKAGSMTKAKEKLQVAQPTLSLQLRQLERSLGEKLYRRGRHGITLTDEGRIAFEYGERIFAQGAEMVSALKRKKNVPRPTITLGMSRLLPREMAMTVLSAVGSSAQATLFTGSLGELRNKLERGDIDFAASEENLFKDEGGEFRSRLAGLAPMYFVSTPEVKRSLGHFPPKEKEAPLLVNTAKNPVRELIDEYIAKLGGRWTIAAETDDQDILRHLAVQGKGVAAISALCVREELADGRLVRLDQAALIGMRLWLTAPALPHPDPTIRSVLRHMMTVFRLNPHGRSHELH